MLWNPQRGGTTVTVIDSFEDSDLSEYNGIPGDYTTVDESNLSWAAPDGSTVLRNDGGTNFSRIFSTSGLSNYFSKGNTARCDVRAETAEGGIRVLFGVEDFNDYYIAQLDYTDGGENLRLRTINGGTYDTLAEDTTVDPAADTTTTLEIVWDDGTLGGSDNEITVRWLDGSGSPPEVSAVDSDGDHATADGIGFVGYGNSSSGADLYMDWYRLV